MEGRYDQMSEIIERQEKLLSILEDPREKEIVKDHLERNKKQLEALGIK